MVPGLIDGGTVTLFTYQMGKVSSIKTSTHDSAAKLLRSGLQLAGYS